MRLPGDEVRILEHVEGDKVRQQGGRSPQDRGDKVQGGSLGAIRL